MKYIYKSKPCKDCKTSVEVKLLEDDVRSIILCENCLAKRVKRVKYGLEPTKSER